MKRYALLPIATLLLAACSEGPMAPLANPGPQFSQGNAFHNLTQPTGVAAEQTAAATITVTWSPDLNIVQQECTGYAALNPDNDATVCTGVHFEVYRNGEHIADAAGPSYVDSGLADGAYSYQIKSKGKEHNSGQEDFTYHSLISESSNVVIIGAPACGPPTVTAQLTAGSAEYAKVNGNPEDRYVQVTFGGTTTNWNGCEGALAQYRIVARNNNNGNEVTDKSTAWMDLLPSFSGADYAVGVVIDRNNQNLRFEFLVQVGHDAAEGWFAPAGPPPSVTVSGDGANATRSSK